MRSVERLSLLSAEVGHTQWCPPWNLDSAYSICARTPSRRALLPVSGSLASGTGLTFQAQIVVAVDLRVDRPL